VVRLTLPDGRELEARQEGPTGNWVARVSGAEERTAEGRWLLVVLKELLDLPRGTPPAWLDDAIKRLAGHETPTGRRFPCPCCDYLTLVDPPTGTFQICPVCRWEDDNLQFVDLDYRGGANRVSLREARENFRRYGVSEPERRTGRPPTPDELRRPDAV